jgi:hypothetical protein
MKIHASFLELPRALMAEAIVEYVNPEPTERHPFGAAVRAPRLSRECSVCTSLIVGRARSPGINPRRMEAERSERIGNCRMVREEKRNKKNEGECTEKTLCCCIN